MEKSVVQICLAVGLAILTAVVSAQAQDSLNIRTQRAVSCNDLGVASLDAAKFDDAIKFLREAIRLRPDYAIAYGNLGKALYHRGQFEEAITALKKAVQLNSNYAEDYNHAPYANCHCRKPKPLMLVRLMHRFGARRSETLFVGDMGRDQEAARRAGVRFLWAHEFFNH